jgi:peptidoglycan hydrolase-like protein with peptidoglycan-binding domain
MTASTTSHHSRSMIIGASTLCALGIAGAVTGIVLATGSPAHHPSSAPAHTPNTPLTPTTPVNPSGVVSSVQRELGQLNYYEGPDDGIMSAQTEQAITYLQRAAGLPQTGVLTPATDQALISALAHGDSQMGGS